ncbi:MAG TPA: HD family hydrolase [candidate division Zixibacteria bacterium]|nr:HD family hydrolase [candidate division Zixibacteria bacterium]
MADDITSFFLETSRLKLMLRSGWIFSGVPIGNVESVADHSYMISLITLIQCLEERREGKEIDLEKALSMALLHDISEGISQDLDRRIRQFAPEKFDSFKHDLDINATKKLLEKLPVETSATLLENYLEFQKKESLEARIVAEADRVEVIIQLYNYIKQGTPKDNFLLFFENLSKEVNNFEFKLIRKIALELLKEG